MNKRINNNRTPNSAKGTNHSKNSTLIPAKPKATWKLNDIQRLRLVELIAIAKIEGSSQAWISDQLFAEVGVRILNAAICEFGRNHRAQVGIKISEISKEMIKDCPLIHKDVRMMEIQKVYDSSGDKKTKLMALRDIRAEIDERGDKIADALRQVGGTFNFDFSGLNDDDKYRLTENIRRGLELRVSIPRK